MALQANELRIGNYFMPEIGTIHKLHGIWQGDNNEWWGSDCDNNYFELDTSNPIQLTPEIFKKMNLSRDLEGWFLLFDIKIYDPLVLGGIGGYVQTDRKNYAIIYNEHVLKRSVTYLHQLQNLYFALTGEELNYTP